MTENTNTGIPASIPQRFNADDALAMLIDDHAEIKNIFKRFKVLTGLEGTDEEKARLARQACNALKIHALIEEEIFYPAVRDAIDHDDLMDEAIIEHVGVNDLVEQIEAMRPNEPLYDAKVIVLGEQIERHFRDEEYEMFPMARQANVDTALLGARMLELKIALKEEMTSSTEREEHVADLAEEAMPIEAGRHALSHHVDAMPSPPTK